MGRYHVRYGILPGVLIPDDFYFRFHDEDKGREIVARVEDPVPKEQRTAAAPLLAIDLRLDADSLSSALHESHKLAHSVTSMLSLMSCTGLPTPSLKFAFDFSDDKMDHDFMQIVDLPFTRRLSLLGVPNTMYVQVTPVSMNR